MAKKKEPSIQDALTYFREVMLRASLTDYTHVNRIMYTKNPKEKSVLVIPEITLWNAILENEEFKKHIKELSLTDPEANQISSIISYGSMIDTSWLDIDSETLYTGKIFNIDINGFEYQLTVNRDCLPVKLKKAEYSDIQYKVFTSPYHVLAIKKYFPYKIENCGFTMMRLFKII